jgi:hypothetical protein
VKLELLEKAQMSDRYILSVLPSSNFSYVSVLFLFIAAGMYGAGNFSFTIQFLFFSDEGTRS